jgi:16S rRNA (cytosine1402-N4)-methyltransferase
VSQFLHLSVLADEVLQALDLQPGARLIDGTFGGGGHSAALLAVAQPGGRLLAIDADPAALAAGAARLSAAGLREAAQLHHGQFGDMAAIAAHYGWHDSDAILLDLGVSSHQLDTAERGFSFLHDGPLDMRMNPTAALSAAEIVNEWAESDLADVIYLYGEERASRRIARAICARRLQRPFSRTADLADVAGRAAGGRHGRVHPATKTFQALRIAVNAELDELRRALPAAVDLLAVGGRLAVISFHSLEDRIVKQYLRDESGYDRESNRPIRLAIETRKPIVATDQEIAVNPRARSAKLRVARRIA